MGEQLLALFFIICVWLSIISTGEFLSHDRPAPGKGDNGMSGHPLYQILSNSDGMDDQTPRAPTTAKVQDSDDDVYPNGDEPDLFLKQKFHSGYVHIARAGGNMFY